MAAMGWVSQGYHQLPWHHLAPSGTYHRCPADVWRARSAPAPWAHNDPDISIKFYLWTRRWGGKWFRNHTFKRGFKACFVIVCSCIIVHHSLTIHGHTKVLTIQQELPTCVAEAEPSPAQALAKSLPGAAKCPLKWKECIRHCCAFEPTLHVTNFEIRDIKESSEQKIYGSPEPLVFWDRSYILVQGPGPCIWNHTWPFLWSKHFGDQK